MPIMKNKIMYWKKLGEISLREGMRTAKYIAYFLPRKKHSTLGLMSLPIPAF